MSLYPLVSVMIPTYNQAQYIEQTINSVQEQTYKNIEIIVSDDSPNNDTRDIVLNKFPHIKYIHNEKPLGRVQNYHQLLYGLAQGEWVLNVDGDDFLIDNTFIEKAIEAINRHRDIVLVFGKQNIYKTDEKIMYKSYCGYLKEGIVDGNKLFIDAIFKNIEIPHLASLYRRDIAIKIGFYQSNILSSDRKSLLKLLVNNKVFFFDTYVGVWNHHGLNASQNSTVDDFFYNINMYDDLYSYAKKHSDIPTVKLWIWKNTAKYKNIYSYCVQLINLKAYTYLKLFLKKLFMSNPLYGIIVFLDYRIYKKAFLNG